MQSFVISKEIIKNRIDPFYYQPEFLSLLNRIKKCSFPLKQLKELVIDIKNGSTPSGGIFATEGVPYFRSQDFNLFDFKIKQFVTPEFHKQLSRSIVKPGDVLIAVVGATLGVIGYVPDEIKEANINQNVARLRVKKEINSKYLAVFLSTKFGQDQLIRNATITTQRYLNTPQLETIKIPLPPRQIQDKIADIMDKAFNERNRKLATSKALLKGIENIIFSKLDIKDLKVEDKKRFIISYKNLKGKRFDVFYYQLKFQNLLKLFDKIRVSVRLLGDFVKAINYGASLKAYPEGEIPFLRIQNLKENTLVLEDLLYVKKNELTESDYVQEGDFLISRSGTIGMVARVPKEANNFAFGSFMIRFKLRKQEELNPDFVWLFLNHKLGRMQTTMSRTGGVQGNITIPAIRNLQIPIPEISTQLAIVNGVKHRQEKGEVIKQEADQVIQETKQKVEKMILGENMASKKFVQKELYTGLHQK